MRKTTAFWLWMCCVPVALAQAPAAASANKAEKPPGFVGRVYHNFHAYFNGYYHAEQLYNEATGQLDQSFEPPEVGFINLLGSVRAEEGVAKDERLQLAIQKCELLIYRRSKSEYLDDARLLMGKCYYFRKEYILAQQNLAYIPIAYPKSDRVPDAKLWLAKLFLAMDDRYSARVALDELFTLRDIDKDVRSEGSLIYAQLLIEDKKYSDAIKVLDDNLETLKDKLQRARAHYALGQLYQQLKVSGNALFHYGQCAKLNASPGLTFRAELALITLNANQASESGTAAATQRQLRRLQEDSRYAPYHEQVYYELALLERQAKRYKPAIEEAQLGIAANQGNRIQKLRNYVLVADIYFENLKKWEPAHAYYDSAATLIEVGDPDFARVRALASSLGELTQLQQLIARNDSLLALSRQPDYEIQRRITFQIAAEEDARERAARTAERQAAAPQQTDVTQTASAGAFYFDNQVAIAQGKASFARQWGQRPNQDNWRRAAALRGTLATTPTQPDNSAGTGNPAATQGQGAVPETQRRKELYAEIPFEQATRDSMEEQSLSALVNLAVLYAERLDRPDEATLLYERVIERAPTHPLSVRARYGLFILLRDWEPNAARRWGDEIIRDFPQSDYARLVTAARDPKAAKLLADTDTDNAYTTLYGLYRKGDYTTVINFVDYQLRVNPLHPEAPRMLYLKGLSFGLLGQRDSLQTVYNYLVASYPTTEVAEIAKGTLAIMANPEGRTKPDKQPEGRVVGTPQVENSPFATTLRDGEQVMVVAFVPRNGIEAAPLVQDIHQFNKQQFADSRLSVSRFNYDNDHLLYVNQFATFAEAQAYIQALTETKSLQLYFPKPAEQVFFIGYQNFRKAFTQRKFDVYRTWYYANRDAMLKAGE